jgi:hypothetical protein
MEGYQQLFNKSLTTVWSAPNYSYKCGNKASVLVLDDNMNFKFNIFEQESTDQDKKDEKGFNISSISKLIPEYFI